MNPGPRSAPRSSRAPRVAAIAFIVLSGYVVLAGRDHMYMDSTGPGPGFFPAWVGWLGLLTGVGLLWSLRSKHASRLQAWDWPERRAGVQIVLTVVGVFLAGLLLETLGFRLAMFLFIAALLRVYGVRWTTALVGGAVSSIAVFFVFGTLLEVVLPVGAWGF